MAGFDSINALGQQFAETNMGESFSYTTRTGTVTSGLVGVFNVVAADYQFQDVGIRKITNYTLISSKAQWGATVPENTGFVTDSSGVEYAVEDITGVSSAGDPAYEITLQKLT